MEVTENQETVLAGPNQGVGSSPFSYCTLLVELFASCDMSKLMLECREVWNTKDVCMAFDYNLKVTPLGDEKPLQHSSSSRDATQPYDVSVDGPVYGVRAFTGGGIGFAGGCYFTNPNLMAIYFSAGCAAAAIFAADGDVEISYFNGLIYERWEYGVAAAACFTLYGGSFGIVPNGNCSGESTVQGSAVFSCHDVGGVATPHFGGCSTGTGNIGSGDCAEAHATASANNGVMGVEHKAVSVAGASPGCTEGNIDVIGLLPNINPNDLPELDPKNPKLPVQVRSEIGKYLEDELARVSHEIKSLHLDEGRSAMINQNLLALSEVLTDEAEQAGQE